MVGTELTYNIHNYILQYLEDSHTPSPLLSQMKEEGKMGFKSGEGFMKWTPEEVEKQNADLKYSAGLLDREAYLKEDQTWLERTASLDAARLALAEAMDDYDWAVLGFVSLR